MKKRWQASDAWRGRYVPVPPRGYEMLTDCSVVNNDPEKLRDMLTAWLRKNRIRYKSGYMSSSNVFSANLYIIVEQGKLSQGLIKELDDWFVNWATSTFSIMSGTERPLDVISAKNEFYEIVARYPLGSQTQFNPRLVNPVRNLSCPNCQSDMKLSSNRLYWKCPHCKHSWRACTDPHHKVPCMYDVCQACREDCRPPRKK